jgi:hypothetical protein
MDNVEDRLDPVIGAFMDGVRDNNLTPLETLGVLSYLTGLYQSLVLHNVQELLDEEKSEG